MSTTNAIETTLGKSGLEAIVHKQDHEAVITIDPMTGVILTPADERPEWAEELSLAQVAERHQFYSQNLGDNYTADMKMPGVLAFEDLGWLCTRDLGVDANGEPNLIVNSDGSEDNFELYTVDAELEHRNSVVAAANGYAFDHVSGEYNFGANAVEVAISRDDQRTPEELEALEASQQEGFKAVKG